MSDVSNIYLKIVSFFDNFYDEFVETMKYLFLPKQSYLNEKLQPIFDKFHFIYDVADFVSDFLEFLKGCIVEEPPTVLIDLSVINSKYNYGDKALAIDFSFYEPYKKYGDVIMSFLISLTYAWHFFLSVPSHISGASSVAHNIANSRKGE